MTKIIKKILLSLLIIGLLLLVLIAFHMQSHAVVTTAEVIPAGNGVRSVNQPFTKKL